MRLAENCRSVPKEEIGICSNRKRCPNRSPNVGVSEWGSA